MAIWWVSSAFLVCLGSCVLAQSQMINNGVVEEGIVTCEKGFVYSEEIPVVLAGLSDVGQCRRHIWRALEPPRTYLRIPRVPRAIWTAVITGVVNTKKIHRLSVDLFRSNKKSFVSCSIVVGDFWPHDQNSVRIAENIGKNSWKETSVWPSTFPFEVGKEFALALTVTDSHNLTVIANGAHMANWTLLKPIQQMKFLKVSGPVEQLEINVWFP